MDNHCFILHFPFSIVSPSRLQFAAGIVSVDAPTLHVAQGADFVCRERGVKTPFLDNLAALGHLHLAMLRSKQFNVARALRADVVRAYACASILLHRDTPLVGCPSVGRDGCFLYFPRTGINVDVAVGQEGRLCVHADVFDKIISIHKSLNVMRGRSEKRGHITLQEIPSPRSTQVVNKFNFSF